MHALNPASRAVVAAWNRPQAAARYAVATDPMQIDLAPGDLLPVPEGATFAALISGHGDGWLCAVVGEGCEEGAYLPREWWSSCPRPGDVVVFHRRALGGGGQGGSNPLRVILTLTVIYLSVQFGPQVGAAFGLSGNAAAAIGATLINTVGQAAINAIVPLDGTNSPNVASQSPTYSASLQGNSARLGQPIPVTYGHQRTYPDFACQPYSEYVNSDQFYHAVLCVGMGYIDVLRVSIEDTPLDHFDEVELLVIGPGQADGATLDLQTLVQTNIVSSSEVASQDMESFGEVGPFTAVPADREAIAINVDFALPRGLDAGRTIEWSVHYRPVNEFEQPTGAWGVLADLTYSTASAVPVRLSYSYTVAPNRYQVRVQRTDARDTSATAAHDISWIGLSCTLNEAGVDVSIPATYIVLRMRATEQLSGISQRRIRVLHTRKLPIWNGTAWSAPTATRSIAWAAADILRNTDYGRGLADDQMDLSALLALDAVWAARFDKYDGTFDTNADTWGALSQVLRVGRTVPLIRGSRYTFVRDAADTEPVAMYSMRNIRRNSFSLQLAVPERDEITAVDVEYWDQTRWDWVTLTVQFTGSVPPFVAYVGSTPPSPFTRAANRLRMRFPGVIGRNHCAREAAYRLADMRYRRSRATYRTALDGLLPAYAAPVLVAHDIPSWGQSGDVANWDLGTLTVTTTEPLVFATGTHYMQLQGPQGGVVTWTVTAGAAPNEAIVADALGFTPRFDSANQERTRYIFGPAVNMGALCRLRAVTPRGERDIEHTVVLEDSRVHDADEPWRPVAGVDPDPAISDGDSGGSGEFEGDVYLVSRALSTDLDTEDAIPITMRFGTNGQLYYESTGAGFPGDVFAPTGEWVVGAPVAPTVCSGYEVRAVALLGDIGFTGSALNTWLPGDSNPSWTANGAGLHYLQVSIREASGLVQTTKTISFELLVDLPD